MSSIGRQLYTSVEARIKERRNVDLSTLQAFLEDYEFLNEIEESGVKILTYAARDDMKKLACDLYMRLFHNSKNEEMIVDTGAGGYSHLLCWFNFKINPVWRCIQKHVSRQCQIYKNNTLT